MNIRIKYFLVVGLGFLLIAGSFFGYLLLKRRPPAHADSLGASTAINLRFTSTIAEPITVQVVDPVTNDIVASFPNLPAPATTSDVVNIANAATTAPLSDSTIYDLLVTAGGYLPLRVNQVTHLLSETVDVEATHPIYVGDFFTTGNITLRDLVAIIYDRNTGGNDPVSKALGRQATLADIVRVIHNFNQDPIGDQLSSGAEFSAEFPLPIPLPTLPSGSDVFNPPAVNISDSGPAVAEYSRTADPDDTITVAGPSFSTSTSFRFYGQTSSTNAVTVDRTPDTADSTATSITLPSQLPTQSTYLAWPENDGEYGEPIAINRTDAWWVGSDQVVAGASFSVYGQNLTGGDNNTESWVYLQPGSGGAGQWLLANSANPYKATFSLPSGQSAGQYQVWAYNGHGGDYGFSGPLTLTVLSASPFAGQSSHVFNVKTYGATGDGTTDDSTAIEAAYTAAKAAAPSTVYFPTGTYILNQQIVCTSNVSFMGDGPSTSTVEMGDTFMSNHPTSNLWECDGYDTAHQASNVQWQGLGFTMNGQTSPLPYPPLFEVSKQSQIRITNCSFNYMGQPNAGGIHLSSQYLQITNSTFTGAGIFGGGNQTEIENNTFILTDYADSAIDTWGEQDEDISNNTARDFDPTGASKADVGSGRFLHVQSHDSSNRNLYLGGNTTVDMSPPVNIGDSNQGEIILFEVGSSIISFNPATATPSSITAPSTITIPSTAVSNANEMEDATIVSGLGTGQTREVTMLSGGTFSVTPPWSITPDSTSTVAIGHGQTQAAIYGNTFGGQTIVPSYRTASVGVEVYGDVSDMVFSHNTLTQVYNGISSDFSLSGGTTNPPIPSDSYFNLISDNTLDGAVRGMLVNTSGLTQNFPEAVGHLGDIYRNNSMSNVSSAGIILSGWCLSGGDLLDSVFEHNTESGAPAALTVTKGLYCSGPKTLATNFTNLNLYKNSFSLGSSALTGSEAINIQGNTTSLWRSGNNWSGFAIGATDTLEPPTPAIP